MKYLCCVCGNVFTGVANNEQRKCPSCGSEGSEHVPEVSTPLEDD